MLSLKSFGLVLAALVAVSATSVHSHILHGRNGAEVGIGLGGLGGHVGIGLPDIGLGFPLNKPRWGHGGQPGGPPTGSPPSSGAPPTATPTTAQPTTGAPTTTGKPTQCHCPTCPINRRCGPKCDQHALQGNVQAFKQAGCCAATPCQVRGCKADYDDFKSYVCSRNFNC